MKLNLAKNWIAKLLSLALAIVIWFLIRYVLDSSGAPFPGQPAPKAIPVATP